MGEEVAPRSARAQASTWGLQYCADGHAHGAAATKPGSWAARAGVSAGAERVWLGQCPQDRQSGRGEAWAAMELSQGLVDVLRAGKRWGCR